MSGERLLFGNLLEWVGREVGVSSWIKIDQGRIDRFADCTGDHQWIHVDQARAATEGPFGTTVAHGFLTLGLIAPAAFEVLIEPAGIGRAMNYGVDRVRFLAPVRAGARVRSRIKLAAAEPKSDGNLLLTTEHTVEIEGGSKPALLATVLVLVGEA